MIDSENNWLEAAAQTVASYRKMIAGIVNQLSDEEFFERPTPETNSVAIILRHLGGNLVSRWTDFLETDGEKENRNRDVEFLDWNGDRASLMKYFDTGWESLTHAIQTIDSDNIDRTIEIRGETHTLAQALTRSITHMTYHVGQIAIIARMVHAGQWQWLTIAPNNSADFNNKTWGTSASRSILEVKEEPDQPDQPDQA